MSKIVHYHVVASGGPGLAVAPAFTLGTTRIYSGEGNPNTADEGAFATGLVGNEGYLDRNAPTGLWRYDEGAGEWVQTGGGGGGGGGVDTFAALTDTEVTGVAPGAIAPWGGTDWSHLNALDWTWEAKAGQPLQAYVQVGVNLQSTLGVNDPVYTRASGVAYSVNSATTKVTSALRTGQSVLRDTSFSLSLDLRDTALFVGAYAGYSILRATVDTVCMGRGAVASGDQLNCVVIGASAAHGPGSVVVGNEHTHKDAGSGHAAFGHALHMGGTDTVGLGYGYTPLEGCSSVGHGMPNIVAQSNGRVKINGSDGAPWVNGSTGQATATLDVHCATGAEHRQLRLRALLPSPPTSSADYADAEDGTFALSESGGVITLYVKGSGGWSRFIGATF